MRGGTCAGALAFVLFAAACSSSSKVASGGPGATPTIAAAAAPGAATTSVTPSASTTGAANSAALPDPCTLLTKDDVSPLFGTTALDTTPGTAGQLGAGSQLCSFGLSVGSQGLNVTVRTFDNYRSNTSYVFPSDGTQISGLGDEARLTVLQGNVANLSVKLGGNVLEIHVEFYTKPVDQSFVETLGRKAVARLPH